MACSSVTLPFSRAVTPSVVWRVAAVASSSVQGAGQPQADAAGAASGIHQELAGDHAQPGGHQGEQRPVAGTGGGDLPRVVVAFGIASGMGLGHNAQAMLIFFTAPPSSQPVTSVLV
ncbi:hypothetical protein [Streptomyces sp. NPDC023838]|uniref:hypothetical protein n=1 Tax=Streptomyces sp. NPDC023838 TaxID=3154325 RepID=UPI0033E10886